MSVIDNFSGKYRFLSNFYPCPIEYEGLRYPSVEAAYQAAKSKDVNIRMTFTKVKASDAKKMGQKTLLRNDWYDIRLQVMEDLLRQKFKYIELRGELLKTAPALLIEENHWDDLFWGMCDGMGDNHLGKLLMKIRDELL